MPQNRLSPAEERLLARFRERLLAEAPPGSLLSIVVFGSRARGDSDEFSDLDVAVMLAPGADAGALRRLVSDIGYGASDELDLLELGLAPIALATAPRRPIHDSIDRDGVVVWRSA